MIVIIVNESLHLWNIDDCIEYDLQTEKKYRWMALAKIYC